MDRGFLCHQSSSDPLGHWLSLGLPVVTATWTLKGGTFINVNCGLSKHAQSGQLLCGDLQKHIRMNGCFGVMLQHHLGVNPSVMRAT